MKTAVFTALIITAVSIAFWYGYTVGPLATKTELQLLKENRDDYWQYRNQKEWTSLITDLHLLQCIDRGNLSAAKRHLNLKLDSWMLSSSADAQNGTWMNPSDEPSYASAFAARLAIHREKYPVEYKHKEVEANVAHILDAALQIERKRDQ